MNKIYFLICLMILSLSGSAQSSFYNIKVAGISGNSIDMASFKGRKILIVNIASSSLWVGQYTELKQLLDRHEESNLIIICFPTNDFNNERKTDDDLKTFFSGTNSQLLLGERLSVKGTSQSPLYEWLTNKSKNGSVNFQVTEDFQKFLISEDGKLIGVYTGRQSPLNNMLDKALRN